MLLADQKTNSPPLSAWRVLKDFCCAALSSFAVWLMYVPHAAVLRLLPPPLALQWARVAARLHWLLYLVGVHAETRRHLTDLRDEFADDTPVSKLLLRHLVMKHENFARWRVETKHSNRSPVRREWRLAPGCEAEGDAVRKGGSGMLLVSFHFASYQVFAQILREFNVDRRVLQLRVRHALPANGSMSWVTHFVQRLIAEADRRTGAEVLYVDEPGALLRLTRWLRKGGVAILAADGMSADAFADVPFFNGRINMPSGWARLAVANNLQVLLGSESMVDGCSEIVLRNPLKGAVPPQEDTEARVRHLVEQAAQMLEERVRQMPWAWYPWERLRCTTDAHGERRYTIAKYAKYDVPIFEPAESIAPQKPPKQKLPVKVIASKNATGGSQATSKLAVLCNSVTPYRRHVHERIVDEAPEVELWTLSTHGNAYNRWTDAETPAVIRPIEFGPDQPTNEQTLLFYSLREWFKAGRIISWLKENRVDAVLCQGCGDVGRLRILRWCARNRLPCFLYGDFNILGDQVAWWLRPLKRFVYRAAIDYADGLMPCGRLGKKLFDHYGGANKPSYWFPFLPDTELLRNPPAAVVDEVQTRFKLSPRRRRIVFSARMMSVKRPDLAIRAFASIADERPEWDLVMVGDGELRRKAERLVPKRLGERVIWTGFLNDPAELAGVYAQCDLLLLPSDAEPWGVVIVEAAAAGLAIVSTNVVGASPELVQPGRNGATFPVGDVKACSQMLRELTAAGQIDRYRQESLKVFDQWRAQADPVAELRRAIREAGLSARASTPVPVPSVIEQRQESREIVVS